MNKKELKFNPEFNSWHHFYFVKIMEEGFEKFLRDSNQSAEMIKNAAKIDWDKVIHIYDLEIKDILKKLEVPDIVDKKGDLIFIYELIVLEIIRHQLYHIFFFHLSKVKKADKTSRKKKIISDLLKEAKWTIENFMKLLNFQLRLANLKKMKDSYTMRAKIVKMKREYSKKYVRIPGKRYKKKKLKLYGEILKENDKIIQKGGHGNYTEVTRIICKKYSHPPKNIYKSFMKFKNEERVPTFEHFKIFCQLYYSR